MSNFPCYDTIVQRSTQKQRTRKMSIHFAADQETIETIFRIIVFANQLSLYGAVANMCEECESVHDRSGQLDVVMGQSIVLSEIKTEVSLESDDPLSQQDKLIKICMDAGFLSVVENGQYFMTKDTEDLTQFKTVACRDYTHEKKKHHNRKAGSKETPKLGGNQLFAR